MTYLADKAAVVEVLTGCGFTNVPGWSRPVLVLWPNSPALVQQLLAYGCVVTVLTEDLAEFVEIKKRTGWAPYIQSQHLRVVFGRVDGYLAAAQPQTFAAVFTHPQHKYTASDNLRRVLTWNGDICEIAEAQQSTYRLPHGMTPVDKQLGDHFVTQGKKKIGWMLMSYPRCGTHMLVTALAKHPQLSCYGEAFNPASPYGSARFESVPQVLENVWTNDKSGFAVHSSIDREGHSLNMAESMFGYSDFWKYIPDYTPTILLTRKNLLARYVSQLIAMETGVWNSFDAAASGSNYAPVFVDVRQFERDMQYVKACWENAAAYFKYALHVEYESLVEDYPNTLNRIQEYLNVDPVQLAPKTVKLALPLEETVQNYVQVRAWCRRMGYGHFITES
jgi:hypothetical protein